MKTFAARSISLKTKVWHAVQMSIDLYAAKNDKATNNAININYHSVSILTL